MIKRASVAKRQVCRIGRSREEPTPQCVRRDIERLICAFDTAEELTKFGTAHSANDAEPSPRNHPVPNEQHPAGGGVHPASIRKGVE